MPPSITIPGVLLSINAVGVLLIGPSSIGKSELALGLIDRNHHLIADDAVVLTRVGECLVGSCPPLLQDFLAIRDFGIINVRKVFGDAAIRSEITVQLVIELLLNNTRSETEPLQGQHYMRSWLNVEIPVQPLKVSPGRNLPLLVETITKHCMLKRNGYSASDDLVAKHQLQLNSEKQ